MNSVATIDAYHGSVHMLCMFQAKKFKESVYPKLPHEPGGNKLNECCENTVSMIMVFENCMKYFHVIMILTAEN